MGVDLLPKQIRDKYEVHDQQAIRRALLTHGKKQRNRRRKFFNSRQKSPLRNNLGRPPWHKVRKDGGPDGRGVGFYFRNTTEIILFGIRGRLRTLAPGRRQVNIIRTQKREHSRKPDELYDIIEACSPGPYLELFARGKRRGWGQWGNEVEDYNPSWPTYSNHSQKVVPIDAKRVKGG